MAKILVKVDLDFGSVNQLLNAVLHKTSANITNLTAEGQIAYDTETKRIVFKDDTSLIKTVLLVSDLDPNTSLGSSNTFIPTQNAVKTYVDNKLSGINSGGIIIKGTLDIVTNPAQYPKGDSSEAVNAIQIGNGSGLNVKAGDAWYIINGDGNIGPITSLTVNTGDLLIALVDNAANQHSDWLILERNINYSTEVSSGITSIATQTEVNTGTNDSKIVTPLKLNNWKISKSIPSKFVDNNTAINAGTTSITHTLNTTEIIAMIYETINSVPTVVTVEINIISSSVIEISTNISLNSPIVVIIG
jgi:hypothetical protein